MSGLAPLETHALGYDKPLCASLDGFTLHAATRAGALDLFGREALLRYVLRPPLAQERLEQRPDGLVRIILKKAYRDGTVAVDMDPLSLLCLEPTKEAHDSLVPVFQCRRRRRGPRPGCALRGAASPSQRPAPRATTAKPARLLRPNTKRFGASQ